MGSSAETLEHVYKLLRRGLVDAYTPDMIGRQVKPTLFFGSIPEFLLDERKALIDRRRGFREWYLVTESGCGEWAEELRGDYGVLVVDVDDLHEARREEFFMHEERLRREVARGAGVDVVRRLLGILEAGQEHPRAGDVKTLVFDGTAWRSLAETKVPREGALLASFVARPNETLRFDPPGLCNVIIANESESPLVVQVRSEPPEPQPASPPSLASLVGPIVEQLEEFGLTGRAPSCIGCSHDPHPGGRCEVVVGENNGDVCGCDTGADIGADDP